MNIVLLFKTYNSCIFYQTYIYRYSFFQCMTSYHKLYALLSEFPLAYFIVHICILHAFAIPYRVFAFLSFIFDKLFYFDAYTRTQMLAQLQGEYKQLRK